MVVLKLGKKKTRKKHLKRYEQENMKYLKKDFESRQNAPILLCLPWKYCTYCQYNGEWKLEHQYKKPPCICCWNWHFLAYLLHVG